MSVLITNNRKKNKEQGSLLIIIAPGASGLSSSLIKVLCLSLSCNYVLFFIFKDNSSLELTQTMSHLASSDISFSMVCSTPTDVSIITVDRSSLV